MYTTTPTDILRANPYVRQDPIAGYLQIGGSVAWLSKPEKPLHIALGGRLGYGGSLLNYLVGQPDRYRTESGSGLLLTPHVDVEANLRPWLRTSGGVGYRWAFGSNTPNFSPGRDFSGPFVHVHVYFGNFK